MSGAFAKHLLERAAALVGGDRQRQHGDKRQNHQNIAALWNAYLGWRLGEGCLLTPGDVARMMVLLKVARTKTGAFNPDDYLDMAGYAAVAYEIESAGQVEAKLEAAPGVSVME